MGDSKIKTPADLKGKTIGVTTVEAQNVISIRAVLSERYGLKAASIGGDFKWAEIPAAQFEAALKAGRVDAVAFSNVAAYFAPKSGGYRSVLHGSKDLMEMYGGPMASVVITAYQPELDKRPQAYIAALKLLKASAKYALENQKEVFGAVAPKYKMSAEDLQTWFTTFAGDAVCARAHRQGRVQEKLGIGPQARNPQEGSRRRGCARLEALPTRIGYSILRGPAPAQRTAPARPVAHLVTAARADADACINVSIA